MLKFLFRLIAIALVLGAAWLAYGLLLPAGPTQEKLVQLKSGSSAHHIAADLANAGIIRSQYAFLLWHYFHRKPLKAGEYAFDHRAGLREVYDRIARGDIYFQTLTVPEGYNMFDIATAVEEAGLGKREDFLKIARTETALVHDLDPQAPSLEGYLFPDTYHFTRTQSLHDVAATMVRRFRQAAKEMGLNENVHDVVTMASIVEKETSVAEERPVVDAPALADEFDPTVHLRNGIRPCRESARFRRRCCGWHFPPPSALSEAGRKPQFRSP